MVPASAASAAECAPTQGLTGCVDADNLWMSAGATRFFSLGSGLTTPATKFSFGLGLSYLSRPIGLRVGSADPSGTTIYLVDNAINATFLWSLGVTDRLELSAAAPITLFQDGAGLYSVLGSDAELPRSGIRDVRFGLAYAFVPRPRTGADEGLALLGRFTFALPTGVKDGFAGSRTMTWVPTVLAEYRLGRLTIAAETGARIRGASSFADTQIGTQVQGSLGGSFDIFPRLLTVNAEAFALIGLDDQPAPARLRDEFQVGPRLSPAEWIVSVSSAPFLGGDLSATLGGGGPIPLADQSAITNPRFRFNLALKYAPTDRDIDADGVIDRDDKCPTVSEDRDGFQDDDGCPELDNDGDGIPDKVDVCMNGAEDKDGFKDTDGCPDPDNDLDDVADADDQCPSAAEDKDGFKDTDGCPDPDNDEDGVLDRADACPLAAETLDGIADGDGCPEAGARSLARWQGNQALLDPPASFAKGSAKPSAELEKKLALLAQLVRGATPEVVIIEGYADRPGDTSTKAADLAEKRALAVKAAFVAAGLPGDIITAASGDPSLKRPAGAPTFDVTARKPKPKPLKKPNPSTPPEKTN